MALVEALRAGQPGNHRVIRRKCLLIELFLVDFAGAHDVNQLRVERVVILSMEFWL